MIGIQIPIERESCEQVRVTASGQVMSLADVGRMSLRRTVSRERADQRWMACVGLQARGPDDCGTVEDVVCGRHATNRH